MEWLEQFDHASTLWVNQHYSDLLDYIMVFASSKFGWLPLYLLMLFFFYKQLGVKGLLLSLPFVALTIVLADQSSVKLFKDVFERYRPCHNLDLRDQLRLIEGCGGKYGFLSSHASNTASIAVLSAFLIKKRWMTAILVAYVMLNMYSRMYLGKHYLSDVLAGAFLGSAIGFFMFNMFAVTFKKLMKS